MPKPAFSENVATPPMQSATILTADAGGAADETEANTMAMPDPSQYPLGTPLTMYNQNNGFGNATTTYYHRGFEQDGTTEAWVK